MALEDNYLYAVNKGLTSGCTSTELCTRGTVFYCLDGF